jgi:hypothetical protein
MLEKAFDGRAERSRVCFGCHSPRDGDRVPMATAAALWAGRGGLDPKSGSRLDGPAPHVAVAGGCIGCHRAGPPELERGAGHAFRTLGTACMPCHAANRSDSAIRKKAEALWAVASAKLDRANDVAGRTRPSMNPTHSTGARLNLASPRGRAAWDIALVLEDPAADAHNAAYARALLDAAAAALDEVGFAPRPAGGGAAP